jgi:alpha-galactosidase
MRGTILDYSTQIESLLVELGAIGRGMHEKLDSIESIISPSMVRKIRWLATIRNKAVHEANFCTDLDNFVENANNAINFLQNLLTEQKQQQEQEQEQKQEQKESNNTNSQSRKNNNKNWKDKSAWEKAGDVAKVGLVVGSAIATIFFSQS